MIDYYCRSHNKDFCQKNRKKILKFEKDFVVNIYIITRIILIIFILHRDITTIERLSTILDVQNQLAERNRTICFFDIGIKENNQKLGRIVFELYDGIVPQTCENFAAFCRGVNGLSYK